MVKALKPLERAPLLYVSVQDAIKDYIFDNNLQSGDPLPSENELSEQLGVSRNSVREAVKALVSLGVVDARRGSGLFVQRFSLNPLLDSLPYALMGDLHDLEDLLEVRRVLEVGMIDTAMQTLAEDDIQYLDNILARMHAHAQRGHSSMSDDREFHQYLFKTLDNRVLLKLLDIFWLTFRKAAQHADIMDIKPLSTYQDHAAILEAVKAKDSGGARAALDRHYDSLCGRLERIRRERQSDRQMLDLP